MKKMRIVVDELQVESFEVQAVPAERGTVHAHVPNTDPGYCAPTQDAYCTYGYGCSDPRFTCGGMQCQTYEAEGCYRWTEGSTCYEEV